MPDDIWPPIASDEAVQRVQAWLADEREAGRCIFALDDAWIVRLLKAANGVKTIAKSAPDRSWWKHVYAAGIKASLDHQSRTPPDGLTEDQCGVWLAGYDR